MDHIEKTARNICEGLGIDPDVTVVGGYGSTRLPPGPKGSIRARASDLKAAWTLFADDARAALAAVEDDGA